MRSIFDAGLAAQPWRPALAGPRLGQWASLVSSLISAGAQIYQAHEAQEAAEEASEAAEARAAAERARAEAEKARLEQERLRLQQEVQGISPTAPGAPPSGGTILGIPQDYVLYGGLGLGALLLVGFLATR